MHENIPILARILLTTKVSTTFQANQNRSAHNADKVISFSKQLLTMS